MLDLVFGGVLCFISTYVGITVKQYYDKRYYYLRDFREFAIALEDNLTYAKDNISTVADKYLQNNKGGFAKCLEEYSNEIKHSTKNDETTDGIFNAKYLKKGERNFIKDFFRTLGTLDYESQLSRIKLTLKESEHLSDKALKDSKTTGVMFSKLGLLIGIALMIILA